MQKLDAQDRDHILDRSAPNVHLITTMVIIMIKMIVKIIITQYRGLSRDRTTISSIHQ